MSYFYDMNVSCKELVLYVCLGVCVHRTSIFLSHLSGKMNEDLVITKFPRLLKFLPLSSKKALL